MKHHMFGFITVLSVFALLFTGCGRMRGGIPAAKTDNPHAAEARARHQAFREKLNITDDQKEEFLLLVKNHLPDLEPLHGRAQVSVEALIRALVKEDYSAQEVSAAVKSLTGLISDGAVKASQMIKEARDKGILTDEQVLLLEDHRRERDARVDSFLSGNRKRHGKHHSTRLNTSREKVIDLSLSQKMEIFSIILENKAAFETLAKSAVPAGRLLRDAVLAEEPSEKEIRTTAELFGKELEKAALLAGSVFAKIRPVLTDEQIEELTKAGESLSKIRKQLSAEAIRKFKEKLEQVQ